MLKRKSSIWKRKQRTWKTGGEGIIVFYSIWAKKKRETPLIRYLQDKLPEWLHLPTDRPIELERAHRALRPQPAARQPPLPITIRFLRFTDKERVLQAAKNNTITVGNSKLTLHQDLSAGDSNTQTSSGFFTTEPCDTSKLPKRQNVF